MRVSAGARLLVIVGAIILTINVVGSVHAALPAVKPAFPIRPPAPTATAAPPPLPLSPATGLVPGWLHTDGTRIVDASSRTVRLAAINWYGAEGTDFVPGGLAYRPYMDILRTIKKLGFNTIRLPFSNWIVDYNPIVRLHLEANPQFRNMHAMDILDRVIAGARKVGLMVILDNHRSGPGWTAQENGLWYSLPRFTSQGWVDDWAAVARRYANNPAVIGFDLRNEPHSRGPGEEILSQGYVKLGATWGPFNGVDDPTTDWRLAAEKAGDAIQAVNPRVLIIVEGVEIYPYKNPLTGPSCPYNIPATNGYCADLYWWGGNLEGAKQYPVILNVPHQLVYSAHEYGPNMHGQRWIVPTMTELSWQQEMYKHWGYLLQATGPNVAPVWIGEFGTPTHSVVDVRDKQGNSQGAWFQALISYLKQNTNVGWGYWSINGTRSGAAARYYGQRDSFGVLTTDWAHLSLSPLLKSLHEITP